MATGVETTGLVLAVPSLFISALEHHNDSPDLIKAFFEYDCQLLAQTRMLLSRSRQSRFGTDLLKDTKLQKEENNLGIRNFGIIYTGGHEYCQ
jgi:hypothetical protein